MTEHEILEELRLADPAPLDAQRPETAWSRTVVLQSIERRSGTMQAQKNRTKEQTSSKARPPRRAIRRWVVTTAAGAMVVVAAVLATVALFGGTDQDSVAPAEESSVLSAESLAGVWVNDGSSSGAWATVLVRFDANGGFAMSDRGRIDEGAFWVGTYEIVDTESVRFVVDDPKMCDAGDYLWRAQIAGDGTMRTEVLSSDAPGTGNCLRRDQIDGWIRVSPASEPGTALLAGEREVEAAAPQDLSDVFGVWLRVGTGEVLQLRLDGTFAVDDSGDLHASPQIVGTVSIEGETMQFASSGSADCPAGTAWEWSGVTVAEDLVIPNQARGTTMRATGPADSCGTGGTEAVAWRLLQGGTFAR